MVSQGSLSIVIIMAFLARILICIKEVIFVVVRSVDPAKVGLVNVMKFRECSKCGEAMELRVILKDRLKN